MGRKPIFIFGSLGTAIATFGFFAAAESGNIPMLFISNALMVGLFLACCGAIYPAFYAEMFTARVRYTGMAVGLQIRFRGLRGSRSHGGGPPLAGDDPASWQPVAWLAAGALIIASIAAATGRETFRTPLAGLGLEPKREDAWGHESLPAEESFEQTTSR